jgi:hypothetical protein
MTKSPKPRQSGLLYYNISTGQLTGREIKAKKGLDVLVAKYVVEGMTKEDATDRARNEMRDNPRKDWRAG